MKENIRISDSLDDIDTSVLDNIEAHYKIKSGVSVDRIKSRVMEGIGAAGTTVKAPVKSRKIRLSILIPAAVLIIAMTFTAYASRNSQAFGIFFSDAMDFISGKTQEINLVDSNNGFTMNLEAAVNDERSGVILFSFTKDDGSEFEKGMAVGSITLDGTGGGYGFSQTRAVSDDMKKMSYCIDPRVTGKLSNRKLTLTVQDLIRETSGEEKTAINLKQLYDAKPINITTAKSEVQISGSAATAKVVPTGEQKQNYDIQLIPDIISGFKLEGVSFIDGQLCIFTAIPGSNMKYDEDIADIRFLVNSKTGEKIYPEYRTGIMPTDQDNTSYSRYVFNISQPELLEDLEPVISYTTKEVIEGRWSVSFRLQGTKPPVVINPNVRIKDNNDVITITRVSVSMTGIYVEGYVTNEKGERVARNVNLAQSVALRNGESITTTWGSTEYDQNRDLFILNYRINGFIDIEDVQAVVIQGIEIPIR